MNDLRNHPNEQDNSMEAILGQIRVDATEAVNRYPPSSSSMYGYSSADQQAAPPPVSRVNRASLDLPEGTITLLVPADLTKKSRGQVKKWLSLMLELAETE